MDTLINAISDPKTIIVLLGIIGIVGGNFYMGSRDARSGALNDAAKTNELIKQNRDELEKQLKDLRQEIKDEREARIRAETLLIERDKRIKELTDQIQDRDPATKEFLQAASKTFAETNGLIRQLLKQNDVILKSITNTKVVVTHGENNKSN